MFLTSLRTAKLGTAKTGSYRGEGADKVPGRVFRNHRLRFVLIAAVAMVILVALAAAAVATHRGDRAPAKEPLAKEPPASLGIDLIHCPKAEPEELPPDALAGATRAALDHVPSGEVVAYIDGEARTTEGAYAVAAYLAKGGPSPRSRMIREGLGCSKLLQDRSVVVELRFPEVEKESASLSQHTVFVAKFEGDYWVWGIGH
jgi:hypothetical protein